MSLRDKPTIGDSLLLASASLSGCRSGRARGGCGPSDLLVPWLGYPYSPRFPPPYPASLGRGLGIVPNDPQPAYIRRVPREPAPAGHPVAVGPPTGALGMFGFAWADGGGMGRHHLSNPST